MKFSDSVIQVFCKAPEAGRVKTRLATQIGEEQATTLYAQMTKRVIDELSSAGLCSLEIHAVNAMHNFFTQFSSEAYEQSGGNLGDRMNASIRAGLNRYSKVVLVGSDCPEIDASYVSNALESLDQHEVVLAPVEDGGYGLVGINRHLPEIFSDIPWSTCDVLAATCRRLNLQKVNYGLLPLTWDLDEPGDLNRYKLFQTTTN